MTDRPDLRLAAEFPAATYEQWRKLVETALKGAPFEQLVARSYDGIAIAPLSKRKADAYPVVGRTPGTPWVIAQRVDHPDPAAANAEALHDLENGANGLALVFAGSIGAYGFGLAATEEAIAQVLDGVFLDAGIALDLDLGPQTEDAGLLVAKFARERGADPAVTSISFGFDPIGAAAVGGGSSLPWSGIMPIFKARIFDLLERGFRGPFAAADGRVVHNSGGSEAQELAYMLGVAVEYLRALDAGDAARRMIYFRISADADQLLTIAKLRALRKLWACVEESCGLDPAPAHIVAETAWRMMAQRDPYVNMLRATIAVFSAGIGGADAVVVLPFTAALGLPDRFARRMARNTQLVLLEESHLGKVADPAAGSGGIESLTDQLCRAAWAQFQEIEQSGGAWAGLEQGLIQRKIAAVHAERARAVARRADALTGSSDFPDLGEAPVAVLEALPAKLTPHSRAIGFDALPAIRLAEPFEKLRDASDRMLVRSGARPKIFLAKLGNASDFTNRATFAKNFFEAAGIEALGSDGSGGRDEMIAAFNRSHAGIACLCSSDAVYAREAIAAAKALIAAGCRHLYLAGRPGESEPALRAAGVEDFVFAGCDAVAILGELHRHLDL